MLVTFRSNAWANITMFGDVAVELLKKMGHSGTIPSALLAADIPGALANLQRELAAAGAETANTQDNKPDTDDPDAPPPVGIRLRAYPLVQLLTASAKERCDVMWAEGHPLV